MCEGIDYMIITSKKLEKFFEPLLKWKNQKGLKVKLMTIAVPTTFIYIPLISRREDVIRHRA